MNTVIRKIGNSEGVILPKELLDRLNLRAGDSLELTESNGAVTLKPTDDTFERQMEAARGIMDRYKVALQKLAE
jgi:putative addiction module antidote